MVPRLEGFSLYIIYMFITVCLSYREMESFNEFAMEQINDLPISVSFPADGSVFDYYLDLQTYRFEPWSKRKSRQAPKHSGYVTTPELNRVAYIAEVYLSYGYNVLLLGERGSGKTSFIEVSVFNVLCGPPLSLV